MVSPEGLKIRLWLAENAKKTFAAQSIEESRANLKALADKRPLPDGTSLEPELASGVPCEWVSALGAAPDKVIIFLHGGGYTIGTGKACRSLVSMISAASGCRGLVPEFRQAPEHPFPAAVDDVTAVYRWLLEQGFPSRGIVMAGESAGGGLALAALVALRNEGDAPPSCGVLLSPWTDLACSGDSMTTKVDTDPMNDLATAKRFASLYADQTDLHHPLISPLYAQFGGLPPLLIQIGTDEMFLDDALRVAEKAKTAGVEVTLERYEGMWHAWHHFAPQMPEARQAIEQIGRYIGRKKG